MRLSQYLVTGLLQANISDDSLLNILIFARILNWANEIKEWPQDS